MISYFVHNKRFKYSFWFLYGTGSYPLPPQGLHDANRFKVNQPPLNGPCFLIASIPYVEHVGVYRHDGIKNGEMAP